MKINVGANYKLRRDVQAGYTQSQVIPAGAIVRIGSISDCVVTIIGTSPQTGVEHHLSLCTPQRAAHYLEAQ